jgi:hypothetical protein
MTRKVGAVDTETILLIGLAGVALYLFMRPTQPPQQIIYTSPTALAAQTAAAGNSTSGIILASATGASGLLNAVSNMFDS